MKHHGVPIKQSASNFASNRNLLMYMYILWEQRSWTSELTGTKLTSFYCTIRPRKENCLQPTYLYDNCTQKWELRERCRWLELPIWLKHKSEEAHVNLNLRSFVPKLWHSNRQQAHAFKVSRYQCVRTLRTVSALHPLQRISCTPPKLHGPMTRKSLMWKEWNKSYQ